MCIRDRYSQHQCREAAEIYGHPDKFSKVKRAWAVVFLSKASFSGSLDRGFRVNRKWEKSCSGLRSYKNRFIRALSKRIEKVQIMCDDAVKVIKRMDDEDAFHYCDPPYVGANQGHYKGYTEEDYIKLLDTLAEVNGKFLLSSYPSALLDDYIKKYKWMNKKYEKKLYSSKNAGRKTEQLTYNYNPETQTNLL